MELEKLEPGELVYGKAVFRYKIKNKKKFYTKTLSKAIISRKYESKYPILDKEIDSLIISKILDKNNKEDIYDIEIIGLEIYARTGFINKTKSTSVNLNKKGFVIEKQTRLENGTFV